MSRKYTLKTRLEKAYENYVKRYKEKAESLSKKGYEMASKMLTRTAYEMTRQAFVAEGITTNINQSIVSAQAYEYSQKAARQMKKTAEKFELEWKEKSILELRKGEIDISGINNWLKGLSEEERAKIFAELPADVKHTNQGYISWTIYGSK